VGSHIFCCWLYWDWDCILLLPIWAQDQFKSTSWTLSCQVFLSVIWSSFRWHLTNFGSRVELLAHSKLFVFEYWSLANSRLCSSSRKSLDWNFPSKPKRFKSEIAKFSRQKSQKLHPAYAWLTVSLRRLPTLIGRMSRLCLYSEKFSLLNINHQLKYST
jgi:hypothetical protein